MAMVIISLAALYFLLLAVFDCSYGKPPWPEASLSPFVVNQVFRLEDAVVDVLVAGLSGDRPLWLGARARKLDLSSGRSFKGDPMVDCSVGFRRESIKDGGGLGLILLRSGWADNGGATNWGNLTQFASAGGWDGVSRGQDGGGFSAGVREFGGDDLAATELAHGFGGRNLLGGGVGVPIVVSMLWASFWVMGSWAVIWIPKMLDLSWKFVHGWGCLLGSLWIGYWAEVD